MTTVETMKAKFEDFLLENEKFERGNNAAGTRSRKVLQELIKAARQRRTEIQEAKKAKAAQK